MHHSRSLSYLGSRRRLLSFEYWQHYFVRVLAATRTADVGDAKAKPAGAAAPSANVGAGDGGAICQAAKAFTTTVGGDGCDFLSVHRDGQRVIPRF